MWNLVMHFSRNHTVTEYYSDLKLLQERISLVVFRNKDCTNFSCFFVEDIK
jgi:uncharacterized protein (DUF486 family)